MPRIKVCRQQESSELCYDDDLLFVLLLGLQASVSSWSPLALGAVHTSCNKQVTAPWLEHTNTFAFTVVVRGSTGLGAAYAHSERDYSL